MPGNYSIARIRFVQSDFSEQAAAEARDRGYLSHVLVEIDGARLYPITFYDPVRLQQDLEESSRHGRTFIADPGMIVLPEICPEAMQNAVQRLCEEGYFDYFVPLSQERLTGMDPYHWPP